MKKISTLLLLFACLNTGYIFAQAKLHVATTPDSLSNLASVITSIQIVKLNESQSNYAKDFKPDPKSGSAKNSVVAYPNTIVHFTISNPMTFLKTRPNDRAKVIFYANGIELKGICAPWESGITDMMLTTGKIPDLGQTADIYIQLKRNDTTQQAWNFLYANKPSFWDNFANVDASIGWEGMSSLKKDPKVPDVNIIFYYNKTLAAWLVLFVALLGGFVYLCFDTNTLHQGDKTKAYSLSLTQLMFWTILVIAAFIYTVILTDIPTSLNSSILIMLGISMGTTGTATMIDNRFKQNNQDISKPTKGFIQDLLTSDGESYSVQRIQSFAWNLVLGLYFITYTIANKSMPVLSSTLLFLAGISSASYVGTKVPENNDLKAQAAAQNNPDNAITNKDNSNDTRATNQPGAQNNVLNGQTPDSGAPPDNKINEITDQPLTQRNGSGTPLPNNGVTVIIPQAIIPETPQVIDTNPQLTNNGTAQNANAATAVQETQKTVDPEISQIIPQANGQQVTTQETQQNTNQETSQDDNQPAAVQETQQNTNLNAEMASQEAPPENVQQITTQETQENTNLGPEIISQEVPRDTAQQITIQETQQNDSPHPQTINEEPVSNQENINETTTLVDNTSIPTPPPIAVG